MHRLRRQLHRRAWAEIRNIETATNFAEVEHAIGNAVAKACGLWNVGVKQIRAKKAGPEALARFEYDRSYWMADEAINANAFRRLLASYIPERLRSCRMYFEFANRFGL